MTVPPPRPGEPGPEVPADDAGRPAVSGAVAALRAELDVSDIAYLDHALRGPVPRRAQAAVAAAVAAAGRGVLARAEQARLAESARGRLARLIGAAPHQVAFVGTNTTQSIAILAQSLPWRAGDRVLVHADEVPGNVLPWRALASRGVRVEVLPSRDGRLRLDDVAWALEGGRVRVVAVAAVALPTGERRDVAQLAALVRRAGGRLVVDGAQALGCLRVGLEDADALCASARKWLLGPPDVGILALRDDLAEELAPAAAGALSFLPGSTPSSTPSAPPGGAGRWRWGAGRLEGGALPATVLAGLDASLELLEAVGSEELERRVLALAAAVARRADAAGLEVRSPRGPGRSGIVHLGLPPSAPADLEERLRRVGVVARVQGADLRVSPHVWNDEGDVERLFAALGRVL